VIIFAIYRVLLFGFKTSF